VTRGGGRQGRVLIIDFKISKTNSMCMCGFSYLDGSLMTLPSNSRDLEAFSALVPDIIITQLISPHYILQITTIKPLPNRSWMLSELR